MGMSNHKVVTSLLLGLMSCGLVSCRNAPQQDVSKDLDTQKMGGVVNSIQKNKEIWTFEGISPGPLPSHMDAPTGSWKIQAVEDAPSGKSVLVQKGKEAGSYFNLATIKDTAYKDLVLSVKLKALAGEEDQGGGVVWRYQNAKNYYIARVNPLEDNYRVYKVVNGRRRMMKSAHLEITPGWHELRIEMKGGEIHCYLNAVQYLSAKDDTFKNPGQIGVWTKADAQTAFDDLEVYKIR